MTRLCGSCDSGPLILAGYDSVGILKSKLASFRSRGRATMNQSTEPSRADFLIVTPLPEERDAILALLPSYRKLPPSKNDIRTYYVASVPVILRDSFR